MARWVASHRARHISLGGSLRLRRLKEMAEEAAASQQEAMVSLCLSLCLSLSLSLSLSVCVCVCVCVCV